MTERKHYLARFVRDVMETCPEGTGIKYTEGFEAELITSSDMGAPDGSGYRVYGNWRLVGLELLGAEDVATEARADE